MLNAIQTIPARELLSSLEDDSVDVVITDPPYDFSREEIDYYQAEFERVSKTGAIVFSPPENQWYTGQCQYLFWVKPISTKNTSRRYSRFVEMIQVIGQCKWITGRHWSQYTNVFTDLVDGISKHPYEKPQSLVRRLILNHTKEGDVVCDPFAGSGTIPNLCLDLGRQFVATDLPLK